MRRSLLAAVLILFLLPLVGAGGAHAAEAVKPVPKVAFIGMKGEPFSDALVRAVHDHQVPGDAALDVIAALKQDPGGAASTVARFGDDPSGATAELDATAAAIAAEARQPGAGLDALGIKAAAGNESIKVERSSSTKATKAGMAAKGRSAKGWVVNSQYNYATYTASAYYYVCNPACLITSYIDFRGEVVPQWGVFNVRNERVTGDPGWYDIVDDTICSISHAAYCGSVVFYGYSSTNRGPSWSGSYAAHPGDQKYFTLNLSGCYSGTCKYVAGDSPPATCDIGGSSCWF